MPSDVHPSHAGQVSADAESAEGQEEHVRQRLSEQVASGGCGGHREAEQFGDRVGVGAGFGDRSGAAGERHGQPHRGGEHDQFTGGESAERPSPSSAQRRQGAGAVYRAERAEDQQGGELAEHQPAVAGVPELVDRTEANRGVGCPADSHGDEAAQGEAAVPGGGVGQQPTASYHQQGDEGADPHRGGEDVQGQTGDGDLVVTGPGGVPGEGRGQHRHQGQDRDGSGEPTGHPESGQQRHDHRQCGLEVSDWPCEMVVAKLTTVAGPSVVSGWPSRSEAVSASRDSAAADQPSAATPARRSSR